MNIGTTPQFEHFAGSDRQTYFSLRAANGEITFTSEGYTAEAGALNGIEAVKRQSCFETNFVRKTNAKGEHWFTLNGNNHEILGRSEMYTTTQARDKGIASVMRDAPTARVVARS